MFGSAGVLYTDRGPGRWKLEEAFRETSSELTAVASLAHIAFQAARTSRHTVHS